MEHFFILMLRKNLKQIHSRTDAFQKVTLSTHIEHLHSNLSCVCVCVCVFGTVVQSLAGKRLSFLVGHVLTVAPGDAAVACRWRAEGRISSHWEELRVETRPVTQRRRLWASTLRAAAGVVPADLRELLSVLPGGVGVTAAVIWEEEEHTCHHLSPGLRWVPPDGRGSVLPGL